MADQDLSQLSDEQLAALQSLTQQRAMKDAANAPGPAKPPSPFPTEDHRTIGQRSFDEPTLFHHSAISSLTPEDARSAISHGGALAVSGGLPWWLAAINGATTNSLPDLATTALGALGIPQLGKIKAATRGANTALGAVKGVGTYQALSRLHALLNGDQQPPLNPMDSAPIHPQVPIPSDLIFGGLAGLAGASQGAAEIPRGPNPLDTRLNNHQNYLNQQAELQTQRASLQEQSAKLNEQALPVQTSLQDAQSRLSAHEDQMASKARDARTAAQKAFQSQQAEYRAREAALGFHVEDAKDAVKTAAQELAEHQKTLAGQAKFGAHQTADGIGDTILDLQKRLDALRNPDTASEIIAPHPDLATHRAEVDRMTGFKPTDNAGLQTIRQKALQPHQDALDQMTSEHQAAVRAEVDKVKDQIRQLQAQQGRVKAGASLDPNVTVMSGQPAWQGAPVQGLTLNDKLDASQKALADINNKYRDAVLARLQHAQTAAGATTDAGADVITHQALKDALAKAKEAHAGVLSQKAQTATQDAALKTQIAQLHAAATKGGYDKIPAKTQMDRILDMVKRPALGGLVGEAAKVFSNNHDASGMMSLGPLIGASMGALGTAAASPTGQKLLQFLNDKVTPSGAGLIAPLVNTAASKK